MMLNIDIYKKIDSLVKNNLFSLFFMFFIFSALSQIFTPEIENHSITDYNAGVIAYESGAVATLLLLKPIGEGYDSDSDDETRFSDNGLFDLAVVGGAKLVVEAGMKGEKKVAEADRLKARVVMLEDMEEKFWEDDTLSCVSDA